MFVAPGMTISMVEPFCERYAVRKSRPIRSVNGCERRLVAGNRPPEVGFDTVLALLHEAVPLVEAVGRAAEQHVELAGQAQRIGFGEQDLQDLRTQTAVVIAAGEIEGIDLYLGLADPEADAARDLVADQDQAQAGLGKVLAEHASRARRLVAEHAL